MQGHSGRIRKHLGLVADKTQPEQGDLVIEKFLLGKSPERGPLAIFAAGNGADHRAVLVDALDAAPLNFGKILVGGEAFHLELQFCFARPRTEARVVVLTCLADSG